MGVVYAAQDERLGRIVAIKTLTKNGDPTSRARLLREARAAAGLNHPGICQVFDVGEEKGELWVAMELLEGESLLDRIARGRIEIDEGLEICLGILGPLEYLHSRGMVHRDLKPSNIFLTPHGVKLLDFSLTVEHVSAPDTRLTQEGSIIGTPHYMAPEQWRAQPISPRTDIFACGAILYELLAGRWAFPGDDPIDVFHACAFEEPPRLTGPAGIEEIENVVRRSLEKKPRDRYATAAEMAAALKVARDRLRNASGVSATGTGEAVSQLRRFIALPFRLLRPDPELDFLASSLPEAISAALAGLEHVVVRSTSLAEGTTAGETDPRKLAAELDVDCVLRGTLMSAGSRLRLNAQLVEVPKGTVVWTLQEEVSLGDLFEVQDALSRRVVEGLAVPLSQREQARLRQDVPGNARAYELYLRAIHARAGGGSFTATANMTQRDLLRACLDADPDFAPAWARYGRVCRIISKYGLGNTEEHLDLARQAFERAKALNPDSPLFHNYYTFFELEEHGEPIEALRRLLGRVRARVADADLYAGLVAAARFGGLYQASLAAHERGRRLDPKLETSVHHTYFLLGQMDRVAGPDLLHAVRGDDETALGILRGSDAQSAEGTVKAYVDCLLAALEGRGADAERAYRRALDTGLRDPEHMFYFARALSRAGLGPVALEAGRRVVTRGFYCAQPLDDDPWLETLRAEPDFEDLRAQAREGRSAAVAAYAEAGGEELLGVSEI